MDNVKYNFKFRERFLADELTPTERQAFEEELERDPGLKQMLDDQIQMGDWISEALDAEEEEEQELEPQKVRTIEPEEPKKDNVITMLLGAYKRYPAAMAAAFAVLVLGAWLLIGRPWASQSLGERVFAAHMQVYSNPEVRGERRGITAQDDPKSQDMDPELIEILKSTYAQGIESYPEAINKLSSYLQAGEDLSGKGLFYRGMSYYGIENTQKAIQDLKDYLALGTGTKYHEAAQYYLSLCLLNEDKIEDARSYLEPIKAGKGVYAGRAKTILEELDDPSKIGKQ